MQEKGVFIKDFPITQQRRLYGCGPTTIQQQLQFLLGEDNTPSIDLLEKKCGIRARRGKDFMGTIPKTVSNVLNEYLDGSEYKAILKTNTLFSDITHSLDRLLPVTCFVIAETAENPYRTEQEREKEQGKYTFHFINVTGYSRDEGGVKNITVAEPCMGTEVERSLERFVRLRKLEDSLLRTRDKLIKMLLLEANTAIFIKKQ